MKPRYKFVYTRLSTREVLAKDTGALFNKIFLVRKALSYYTLYTFRGKRMKHINIPIDVLFFSFGDRRDAKKIYLN
ncbi:MAG: hypothetical protein V2A54_04270 [Bacteroidota bacterium]